MIRDGIIVLVLIMVCIYLFKRIGKERPFGSYIEQKLYYALLSAGYDVRKQAKCGPYYVDIALPKYKIAIECDGKDFHSSPSQKKYDKKRSAYLYRHGYKHVIRFTGSEINKNPYECVNKIDAVVRGGRR
jgi:very-short-patch-repair endonuclease